MTASGWISSGLMYWSDGGNSGAFVVDNSELNSRFRFRGQAKINGSVGAGFDIELGLSGNFPGANGVPSSNCVDQDRPSCGTVTPNIRNQQVWIAHNRLGRLVLGRGDPPSRLTKNWAGRVAGTQFWGMDSTPQVGMSMKLRGIDGATGTLRWRNLIDGRTGPKRGRAAWHSPKIQGLQVAVGAGTDDHWDAGLYYANGDLFGFRVFGALGYIDDTTPDAGSEFSELKGSFGALHRASGVYAWFASASRDLYNNRLAGEPGGRDWYAQIGWKHRIFSVGATALSLDYGEHQDIRAGLAIPNSNAIVGRSAARFHGIGVTQWLRPAATELYVGWRHYQATDLVTTTGQNLKFEDLDVVIAGARIKF